MRECTVCDEDISHRHGNAKYCRECSKEVLKIQCKQKNTKYSQTVKPLAPSRPENIIRHLLVKLLVKDIIVIG